MIRKSNGLKCDNWSGIFFPPGNAILAKINLQNIKEHLKSLVNREQNDFRSWSFLSDHIEIVSFAAVRADGVFKIRPSV